MNSDNHNSPKREENLASIFQELFTAIERLRANRQSVSDAESFRRQIRESVKSAAQQARNQAGYAAEDVRMATLAVVGFLDETILNVQNNAFGDWPRKPLQEELFGTHTAGEVFFENLQTLLGRDDSAKLADVLEVHYLCLLLGYRGRYSLSGSSDLQGMVSATARKIRHIRGEFAGLAPESKTSAEPSASASDPVTRRFSIAAAVSFALWLVLFVAYKLALGSGVSGMVTGV
jgi:type VI secretion system protein ImpK